MNDDSISLECSIERGIFPLVATKDERIYPVGTAFCVSKFGLLLTAEHNLREAFFHHDDGDYLRSLDRLPDGFEVQGLGLAVIRKQVRESSGQMSLWPIQYTAGGHPTDVLFAFPQFQKELPLQLVRLSFDIPRVGSTVLCMGYSDMQPNGMHLREFQRNPQRYSHQFHCIKGVVKAIFIDGFATRFIEGACAVVECEVPHGVSGGPVFNEAGHVWGIVSAGASTFFGHKATIVSLLYPMLFTAIKVGAKIGTFEITGQHPLVSYIASGHVHTDGSEEGLTIHKIGDGKAVGPRIHREDAKHVFVNFDAFLAQQPAEPFMGENWRIKIKSSSTSTVDSKE